MGREGGGGEVREREKERERERKKIKSVAADQGRWSGLERDVALLGGPKQTAAWDGTVSVRRDEVTDDQTPTAKQTKSRAPVARVETKRVALMQSREGRGARRTDDYNIRLASS